MPLQYTFHEDDFQPLCVCKSSYALPGHLLFLFQFRIRLRDTYNPGSKFVSSSAATNFSHVSLRLLLFLLQFRRFPYSTPFTKTISSLFASVNRLMHFRAICCFYSSSAYGYEIHTTRGVNSYLLPQLRISPMYLSASCCFYYSSADSPTVRLTAAPPTESPSSRPHFPA